MENAFDSFFIKFFQIFNKKIWFFIFSDERMFVKIQIFEF